MRYYTYKIFLKFTYKTNNIKGCHKMTAFFKYISYLTAINLAGLGLASSLLGIEIINSPFL